jgi:hypothetical protein
MASGKLTAVPEFESMYESFNPLTTVNKQHFVEWFSGKQLPSYWNIILGSGSTANIADTVDGGAFLTTGSTATNSNFQLNFNNKRQYNESGSVCIFIIKPELEEDVSTNWFGQCGLGNVIGNTGHWVNFATSNGNIRLGTSQSEGHSFVDTGDAFTNAWYKVKIENLSASCEMQLSGVLKATATTGLQSSTGMQPVLYFNRGTNTPAGNPCTCNLRYFEAYNT